MKRRSLKERLYIFLARTALPALICLFGWTWKVRYVGKEHEESVGSPLIWAFWHSRQLPLVYFYRKFGIYVLVSQSLDGEIISRVLHRLGFRTVRGSSSRGGARSLVEVLRKLAEGARVAFTPDGPRGPKEIARMGVAAASIKSGVPIIPVTTASSRYWKLSSWDGFRIPKPFALVEIRQSEPIYPENKKIEDLTAILQEKLREITFEADESVKPKARS